MSSLPSRSASNPVQSRARMRRNLNLVGWWGTTLLLVFWLSAGGPIIVLIPLAVIGVLVVTNTMAVVRHTGPEDFAIGPDRLSRADTDGDPVSVPAIRSGDRRAKDRDRQRGQLCYDRKRLRFEVTGAVNARRTSDDDPSIPALPDLAFDVRVNEVTLGPPPTTWRPQLVLHADDTDHLIDFCSPGDLSAGPIGAIVARSWWDQLGALGARTT